MSELTAHQRAILIAMLQGKRIERKWRLPSELTWIPCDNVLYWLDNEPSELRIAPKDEAVRLYGDMDEEDYGCIFTQHNKTLSDTHYIDISPNGFIVGGKCKWLDGA